MVIMRGDKFKFSSTFYAINWAGFAAKVDPTFSNVMSMSVPAIWFKRQNGQTVVCEGTLNGSANVERFNVNLSMPTAELQEFFKQIFDGRYGGSTVARWDGTSLWAPHMNFPDMVATQKLLEPLLEDFKATNIRQPPAGYEGWYSINDKS